MPRPAVSIVLPIYNEEPVIAELSKRLSELLKRFDVEVEVVFVNDGSRDRSFEMLRELAKEIPQYRVLSFSRNFGHQAAITAGVDYATGEAVVVMDADLQDPPEVVLEMVEKWKEGYDVVYARRRSREGESWFKLLTAKWFYRVFAAMVPIDVPLDTGDFRLMSRRVVAELRKLREAHRFVRGIVSWVGFKQIAVHYDRPARFAGETKYPLSKMIRFAIDGITSFSVTPLRISTYIGFATGLFGLGVAVWALLSKLVFHDTVQGWTAVVVLVSIVSSVQFLMIGIVGEYVGRVYEQVKQRPIYIVADTVNTSQKPEPEQES
jgi:glycosyltransferase involved in cell wall biosynthesis